MADFTNKQRLQPLVVVPNRPANVSGVSNSDWFGPLQPMQPVTPTSFQPRQYGYPQGANLTWQPKGDSPIDFWTLRVLADSWDLLRNCIRMKKNQICGVDYVLRARKQPDENINDYKARAAKDPELADLRKFFLKPDGVHPWRQWLRMWVEDVLVLDAAALWAPRDSKSRIMAFVPIAGDTINRILTERGTSPVDPESTAYQQVLYGTPVFDFKYQDLVYSISEERTHQRYGYSRVEQALQTIAFGLRRQEWQISEYTSGNTPEALAFMSPDLPIERVKEFQQSFDEALSGDLAKRRRITFLPGIGGTASGQTPIIFPKQALLKDDLDVWLAQVMCSVFGISFQPFAKQMNRASSEEANDAAEREGLKPDVDFVLDMANELLERMGVGDEYEFTTQPHQEVDLLKRSQADSIDVRANILTPDEAREMRGLEPLPQKEGKQLQGALPPGEGQTAQEAAQVQQKPMAEGDEPDEKPKGKDAKKLAKASRTGAMVTAERGIRKTVADFLDTVRDAVISALPAKVIKAKGDKTDEAIVDAAALALVTHALDGIDWTPLAQDVADYLTEIAQAGGAQGLAQVKMTAQALLSDVNVVAGEWAQSRAAELVGKRLLAGHYVDNPNAEFAISDTTRSQVREIVTQALSERTTIAELAQEIQEAATFSAGRAKIIAKTEASRAQQQGNLAGWRRSGVVSQVEWLLSADHDDSSNCDCSDLAASGPYDVNDAPECPDHPNCMCGLSPILMEG